MNPIKHLLWLSLLFPMQRAACIETNFINEEQMQQLSGKSLERINQIYKDFTDSIQSNESSPSSQDFIEAFPKLINELSLTGITLKTGVEIGVFNGAISECLLANTQVEKLYSIDPWVPNPFFLYDGYDQGDYDIYYYLIYNRLKKYESRSEPMRAFAEDVVQQFDDASLDFVFIDGNHSYESVKNDIQLWNPKIRSGGILSGDDFNTWPGVSKAVNEYIREKNLNLNLILNGRIWWVQLP